MEWNGMEWNGMEWNGMEWNLQLSVNMAINMVGCIKYMIEVLGCNSPPEFAAQLDTDRV